MSVLRRLTYANVMSTLAVFIALGGTSYAVARASIGSAEIKNNSVEGVDVRNRTLASRDVTTRTLRDLRAISGLQTVQETSAPNSVDNKEAVAECPAGKRLIGTGGRTDAYPPERVLISDIIPRVVDEPPGGIRDVVVVQAHETDPLNADWTVTAYAICAEAPR